MHIERRFTLCPGAWCACEFIGDFFQAPAWTDLRARSAIRVEDITPLEQGDGSFELRFWHLNYAPGVQEKVYRLRTLERGTRFQLAVSEHDPPRILLMYRLTKNWLERWFPDFRPEGELKEWLDRQARSGDGQES